MSDKLDGAIIIDLDYPRRLHFDFNALNELEQMLGESTIDILESISLASGKGGDDTGRAFLRIFNMHKTTMFLRAGLLHQNPGLGFKEAAELFNFAKGDSIIAKYIYVATKIVEAFVTDMAGREAVKEAKKKQTETLIGK